MVFKKSLFMLILSALLLAACNDESASQQIYNHLEKAVELEDTFEKQQDEIVKLEKQEQEIYNQIIDLGMDKFDKIKELSKKAIESIEKRKEKIELENESIQASKEEFLKIEDLINDLEKEEAKKKANELFKVMKKRYEAYDGLNNAYMKTLELEKELYTLLQQKELKQEKLSAHIKELNESYEKVLQANEKFNNLTADYNKIKKEFYKSAGLDVNYQDDKKSGDKDNTSTEE